MDFEIIKTILADEAKALGITEYEVYAVSSSERSVETLNKEISSFSSSAAGGICFRALVDSRMGYAATELYEENEIRALVGRALENAKITEKLDTVGIYAGSESYAELEKAERKTLGAADMKKVALELSTALFASSEAVRAGTLSAMTDYTVKKRLINSLL